MVYLLFECLHCGAYNVFPCKTGDGNGCIKCRGPIVPINRGSYKEIEQYAIDKGKLLLSKKRLPHNKTVADKEKQTHIDM